MDPTQETFDLPALSVLCEAAREAGELALGYFGQSPKTWTKPGNSPVTEADLAIDRMLHTNLRQAFPSFGWLSEEIDDDGSRLSGAPTFVVDPIDGTRGFMAQTNDWAVSIALVNKGDPVMGVLFNPVRGELLMARAGEGAHLENAAGEVSALTPSGAIVLDNALITHPGPPRPQNLFRKGPRLASLALRLAHVATGDLDGCIAGPNAKHWDIAAADIIVREAGLVLLHADGATPRYDGASIKHPALICGTAEICAAMGRLVT